MTLKEKMYLTKISMQLGAIVEEAIKNPNPIQYVKFNAFKDKVANTILSKGYTMKIYEAICTKTFDEWVEKVKKERGIK